MKDILKKVLEVNDVRKVILDEEQKNLSSKAFLGYAYDKDITGKVDLYLKSIPIKIRVRKAVWDNPKDLMYPRQPLDVDVEYDRKSLEAEIERQIISQVSELVNRSKKVEDILDGHNSVVGSWLSVGFPDNIHFGVK